MPCFYFYFTASTNYLAKAFVTENNLTAPLVVVAKEQSQGRGRYVMAFDRYQTAPKEVADKVIAEAKARQAE